MIFTILCSVPKNWNVSVYMLAFRVKFQNVNVIKTNFKCVSLTFCPVFILPFVSVIFIVAFHDIFLFTSLPCFLTVQKSLLSHMCQFVNFLHCSVFWFISIQINQTDRRLIRIFQQKQTALEQVKSAFKLLNLFWALQGFLSGIWGSALQLVAFLCSSNAIIFSHLSVFVFPVLPSYSHFLFWATPGF